MTGIDATLLEIAGGLYDIQLSDDGDILTEDAFDTAIIVSIFSDRRASESEVPNPEMRRGWIGNESTPGIEIGSKLWLYEQARLTRTTLIDVTDVINDCLEWFVEDSIAVSIASVKPVVTATGGGVELKINRANSKVDHKYFTLWENTGA